MIIIILKSISNYFPRENMSSDIMIFPVHSSLDNLATA